MLTETETHLAYKIANAEMKMFPFPHIYLENVFPADFYKNMLDNLPHPDDMHPIESVRPVKGYKERFVLELSDEHLCTLSDHKNIFWKNLKRMLVDDSRFGNLVFSKFEAFIGARFEGKENLKFYSESLLVEDTTNYALGPHTDSPRKVVTMLFYLPSDTSQAHLGTSIYIPNDPQFKCSGGPHHRREDFTRVHTNPFLPNSLFAFVKSDKSFHGVERLLDPDSRRWLLLYDIYVKQEVPTT
jgi:hypothetical protein